MACHLHDSKNMKFLNKILQNKDPIIYKFIYNCVTCLALFLTPVAFAEETGSIPSTDQSPVQEQQNISETQDHIDNQQTQLIEENLSPVPALYLEASELKNHLKTNKLFLRSSAALVMDERDNVVLYERKANKRRPIASITKLMTAMVLIDAQLRLDEAIIVTRQDHDHLRRSRSRLRFGTTLSRANMLLMALAASENRAAAALARTFPGGSQAFVKAMNRKGKELGLFRTKFMDAAGLNSGNVSTPKELAILIETAFKYPLIRQMSTTKDGELYDLTSGRSIKFVNTNRLVRNGNWDIGLSKTGFISEAGFCLVMRANIADRPLTIILLNSWGKLSKYGDANRIKKWLIKAEQKFLSRKSNLASTDSL